MIVFRNKGLIDLTAVETMGVSVKEEGAIGYFGTGVKFAIATILRGGGTVYIHRGPHDEHRFGTTTKQVREKDFDIVTMNGKPLGFTTQLGRDWKPWMAFRELACNALDEGGSFEHTLCVGRIEPDETVVVVDSEEIEDAYFHRGEVLLESPPIHVNPFIEIRPGSSKFLYYRGVRVYECGYPTRHTYNLLRKMDLTEDRTLKYSWEGQNEILRGLLACEDDELVYQAVTCGEKHLEHHLSFAETHGVPSAAFLRVAARLRANMGEQHEANSSVLGMARMRDLAQLGPAQSVDLHPVELQRFQRAKTFLLSCGYDLDAYPIVIVDDLGSDVYGLAQEGKIFIAKAAFQKGTKEVASTLLEEFIHLKTGYGDMTRQLQTWLFDELLQQCERASGTAL